MGGVASQRASFNDITAKWRRIPPYLRSDVPARRGHVPNHRPKQQEHEQAAPALGILRGRPSISVVHTGGGRPQTPWKSVNARKHRKARSTQKQANATRILSQMFKSHEFEGI